MSFIASYWFLWVLLVPLCWLTLVISADVVSKAKEGAALGCFACLGMLAVIGVWVFAILGILGLVLSVIDYVKA